MRIAYLVSRYPSANHTYILREILSLRARGVAVEVVAIDGDERDIAEVTEIERAERASTFVVKRTGVRGAVGAHVTAVLTRPRGYGRGLLLALRLAGTDVRRAAYNLAYFAEAVIAGHWMQRRGLERVHTHYASTVTLLLAAVYPVTASATIHGSAEFINPEAQLIRQKMDRLALVVAISRYGASQLMLNSRPETWDKVSVVPLGVDVSGVVPAIGRRRAKGDVLRVAFVGQLQPAKGVHLLLEAVAALVASGREVRLTIVGDGPERAGLTRRADQLGLTSRLVFMGRLTSEQVRGVLEEADVFVLPSFAEGVPVVLMEAMAVGVPCIASRITGIPELIRDEVDGILVPPADVVALVDALVRASDDPDAMIRMAHSARARVADKYDLETNVGRLAAVLTSRPTPVIQAR